MSRREELNIFSTSFIDMICVALCSQIILWIIVEDEPAPVPREKQVRYFEITQFGINHLMDPAKLSRASAAMGDVDYNLKNEHSPIPGGGISGVTLQPLMGDDDFAGGLRIFAIEDCEAFELEIPVEACTATNEPKNNLHFIRCETSYLKGKARLSYFLCEQSSAQIARKNPVRWPGDPRVFCENVIAIPPAAGKLRIKVSKRGLIQVICVKEDSHLTHDVREQLKALADRTVPAP